ncbi:hypothetical protein AB3662_43580 [Sorangium cellulosum]|uniref:hypothetical protein n=1 Tax=Sorangium cellulosum TaxID=56 RepID=UPI003D9A15FA
MKFTVETHGKKAMFDGSVSYGNNSATVDMAGAEMQLVEFLCGASGITNGYSDISFELTTQGRTLVGCNIVKHGRNLGLLYMQER